MTGHLSLSVVYSIYVFYLSYDHPLLTIPLFNSSRLLISCSRTRSPSPLMFRGALRPFLDFLHSDSPPCLVPCRCHTDPDSPKGPIPWKSQFWFCEGSVCPCRPVGWYSHSHHLFQSSPPVTCRTSQSGRVVSVARGWGALGCRGPPNNLYV